MAIQPLTFTPQSSQPVQGGAVGGIHPLTGPGSAQPVARPTVTPTPTPTAKVSATPTPTLASPNFLQQAQGIAQNIINQVKGMFTPTGGKPQPITSAPAPTAAQFTSSQSKAIGSLKVGQIIPDFQPSPAAPSATTKPKTNIIDTTIAPKSTIAGLPGTTLSEAPKKTIWDNFTNWFNDMTGYGAENQKALAQNAYAIQKNVPGMKDTSLSTLATPPGNILKNSPMEQVSQQLGLRGTPTTSEMAQIGMTLSMATALPTILPKILIASLGLTAAIDEVKSNAIALITKQPLSLSPKYTLADLAPNAPPGVKNILNALDFIGTLAGMGMIIGKAITPKESTLTTEFIPEDAQKIVTEKGIQDSPLGKDIIAKADEAKLTGKNVQIDIAGQERNPVGKALGVENGTATVKVSIVEPSDVLKPVGNPLAKTGTIEFTPEQAQSAVVGSDLENTPAGKEIIKVSMEAKQQGQNIQITVGAGGVGTLKTPGGAAISNIQLVAPTPEGQTPQTTEAVSPQETAGPAPEAYQTPVVGQPLTKVSQPVSTTPTTPINPLNPQAQKLVDTYRENNKGNLLNADNVRELFTSEGYNRVNSADYHDAASALTNEIFKQEVAQLKPGDNYIFMAGSSGAGKSVALKNYSALTKIVVAGLDGNFSSNGSIEKLGKVIATGARPTIFFVYRDPVDAWKNGVVKRAINPDNRRVVPAEVFLDNLKNSPKKVLEAKQKYGDKVNIQVFDNSLGKGNGKVVSDPVDFLRKISYNIPDVSKQITSYTEAGIKSGQINPETGKALLGKTVPAGNGKQPQPQRESGSNAPVASKPEVTTPSAPPKNATQPTTEPSTKTAPTKAEQSAIDTVYEALSHDDPDGAHALYEMYTTEDKLTLPSFKEMVDSVTGTQKEELASIATELQKESTGKSDDPTTVLLGIADKMGKHFNAPGAVFKITGQMRSYETASGKITVGGDMASAFDNLIFATDLEGFSKNVRVLSDKFNKVFTQIRGIIDHGDIDGADYEQFKQSIEAALAKRPAYRAGRGAVSKVGAQKGKQESPVAGGPAPSTTAVTPDPEIVNHLKVSINEGETLLSSNKDTLGKTLTPEKSEMIQRAVDHSKAKLALITPAEFPQSPPLSAPGSPTPFPEATETPMAPETTDRGVGATIPSEAFNGTELKDLLGAPIKEKAVKPSQESMLGITGKGSISGAEAVRVFQAHQGKPETTVPTPMEEAVAKSEFEKRQSDLFAGQGGFIDPKAILTDIKAQMEKAKQGKEDANFGTALRMYFVGERDVRIAETNQFVLSAEKLAPKPIQQEALTLMRDFAKRPEELQMILAGTHPYYDHAVEQFKEENPEATDKEIEKFSGEILARGAKLKAVVEQAMNPTPGMKTINEGMTKYFTSRLEEGQKLGFIESKVSPEEYITHMLIPKEEAERPEGPKGVYAGKNKIGRYFQFAKGRAYKDVVEAYLNGVDPRTLNALDAMSIYGDKHAQVAATKLLIQQLKDTELGKFGTRKAEYIPADWKEIAPESSLFRNEVPFVTTAQMEGLSDVEKAQWEKLVKDGRAKIVGDTYVKADVAHQGLFAPKKVVDALKPITDADYMNLVPGFRTSRMYQAYIKSAELSLSIFHMRALTITQLANDGVGGIFRSAFKDLTNPKFLEQEKNFIRAGGTTSILGRTIEAYSAAKNTTVRMRIPTRKELLMMTPGLKQMSGIAQAITHETFGVIQRRMKVTDFATFDAAWIAKHPNATPAEHYAAQGNMAKEINSAYGGLQWEILGVNKMSQAILKFFMLAPDWTYSNIFSVKYVFEGGPAGQHARSFWVRTIIYGFIINQLWSLLMSGHLSKDPTKAYLGKDRFGKEIYSNIGFAGAGSDFVNLIKNINDYGVVQGFMQSVAAKEAPLIRTGTEFLTNRNYLGQPIIPKGSGIIAGTARSAYELATGLSPIPFTLTDYFNMLTDPKKQFIPAEYATILLGGARATHIAPAGMRQVTSGKKTGQLVPASAPGKARPFWEQVTTGKLTQPKK